MKSKKFIFFVMLFVSFLGLIVSGFSANHTNTSNQWQHSNVDYDNILYVNLAETFNIILVSVIVFGSVLSSMFIGTHRGSGLTLLIMSVVLMANGINILISFGLMLLSLYIISLHKK